MESSACAYQSNAYFPCARGNKFPKFPASSASSASSLLVLNVALCWHAACEWLRDRFLARQAMKHFLVQPMQAKEHDNTTSMRIPNARQAVHTSPSPFNFLRGDTKTSAKPNPMPLQALQHQAVRFSSTHHGEGANLLPASKNKRSGHLRCEGAHTGTP